MAAASNYLMIFMILTIVAILVPSSLATEFVVGDDKGWTVNYDYQSWSQGKEFHVVFKYTENSHNVLKVNGTGFQVCVAPAGTDQALTSGNDIIPLATPGRKWYICGVSKHCEVGNQKLFITVLPQTLSPASAPSPISAAWGCSATANRGWIVAIFFGILMMVMF